MRYENFIIVVLEADFKLQTVVVAPSFLFHRILVVRYIFSVAVPTVSPWFLCLFHAVKQWLLALIIGAVRLNQINDCKFVFSVLSHI